MCVLLGVVDVVVVTACSLVLTDVKKNPD